MLAYKREDFAAAARRRAVSRWADEGLVDASEAEALLTRFPQPFYSPNTFIRIGLFVFGLVCASAGLGLFLLAFGAHGEQAGFGMMLALYGAGSLAVQETLARRRPKPYFRAGLEEAAAYFGLACLIAGIFLVLRIDYNPLAPAALGVAVLCAPAAVRYADALLACLGLAAFVIALLDMGRALGTAGVMVLPPLVIAFAAAAAFACGKALRSPPLAPWNHVWTALRLLALLLAYSGGNYFAVRELGAALLPSAGRGEIPLAPLFLAYTYLIPPAYVFFGLRRKDRLALDAGLIAAAAAILTYKAYHDLLSLETGLTLAGLGLLLTAWSALKAFRPPRFGISAAADKPSRDGALREAAAWEAWNSLGGHSLPSQSDKGPQGGGGKFGGGGAQGGF
jgi:hypothetical protein